MPTIKRVPDDTGASGKTGVLNVYSYVKLGPTGTKIVELVSHYPKVHEIYVTSGMDGNHGKTSHHYGLTYGGSPTAAIDFGARDRVGVSEGARRMRDFAAWLEDKAPGYKDIVELIHTTPYSTDNGYYVRHGKKLGGSGFGAATNAAHADHVHLGMSRKQVEAALRRVKATAPKPPVPQAPPTPTNYDAKVKPIFGWDASDFDHERGMRASHIAAAARDGIRFFAHKISDGTGTTHAHCGEKLKAAIAAGIPFVGAYVVARTPGNNGHGSINAQADYAITALTRQFPGWKATKGLFLMVDLEHWSYDKVAPKYGVELVNALVAKTGKRALLYAPRWAYGDTIPAGPALWASNYNGSGSPAQFKTQWARTPKAAHEGFKAYSGRTPVILQFASDAVIGGQHTCDADVFLGTEADFAKLIGR